MTDRIRTDSGQNFWRDGDGWLIEATVEIDVAWTTFGLAEFIQKVQDAAVIFAEEPTVSIETELSYEDSIILTFALEGKRRATEAEVEMVERWIASEPARQAAADLSARLKAESELMRIRAQYPDLV